MSIAGMLTVLIGLSFLFFLLSLIVSWLQELIATLLKWRSRDLVATVRNLLDPSSSKGDALAKLEEVWSKETGSSLKAMLKSNPLKTFYEQPLIKGLSKPGKLPSYISSRDFANGLLTIFLKAGTENSPISSKLDAIMNGVQELGNKQTRDLLSGFVDLIKASDTATEKQVALFRTHLESWFDSVMARAQGWYKRKAQYLALGLSVAVAVLLNADAIRIVAMLWNNAGLNAAIQAAATSAVTSANQVDVATTLRDLAASGLPIGWVGNNVPQGTGILLAILGWIITGLAVAQGSPFWFDLLNRLVNVRGTGSKPAQNTGNGQETSTP